MTTNRKAYYMSMSHAHEAQVESAKWKARACMALGQDSEAQSEMELAATYRRLAESYRLMARGEIDEAIDAKEEG